MNTQKNKPGPKKTTESSGGEGGVPTHGEDREQSPWPTRDSGVVPGDGRTWADFDDWLRARGTSLQERVEILRGGRK